MTRRELLDALTHDVRLGAVALLGATLVSGNKRAKIVETEAYRGIDDPGSHAHRGPTPRNQIMFGPPGYAYVYFTYGMHWMLNVTAQTPGIGAAVLIRAAQPLEALEEMRSNRARAKSDADLLSGPAKICAAFGVEAAQYGLDLLDPNCELRIEPEPPPLNILFGPRIGLAEGKGERHRWRFVDGDLLPWVSKPKTGLEPLKQAPNTIDPEASPRPSSSASPDRRSAKPRSPEAAPVPKASKRTGTTR